MFTGIIEDVGTVQDIEKNGNNKILTIASDLAGELSENQSVAHNGACLSVTDVQSDTYTVTAVRETLHRTTLGTLQQGASVNLERALPANGRFEGHFVQAHVDEVVTCESIKAENGSWRFTFSLHRKHRHLVIPKGSIAINGVSLTIAELNEKSFSVAIIPQTYEHTNFNQLKEEDPVNLEYDVLGKYMTRLVQQ